MTKSWEKHKAAIIGLYKQENRPLHEVQAIMKQKHKFDASTRAYRTRFGRWGLNKYNVRRQETVADRSARPKLEAPSSPSLPSSPTPSTTTSLRSSPSQLYLSEIPSLSSVSSLSPVSPASTYSRYHGCFAGGVPDHASPDLSCKPDYHCAQVQLNNTSLDDSGTCGSAFSPTYSDGPHDSLTTQYVALPFPPAGYKDGLSTLCEAIRHDHSAHVNNLLQNYPQAINCNLDGGLTPLHMAVLYHSHEVVSQLLVCDADTGLQDDNGDTPLHYLFRQTGWWREEGLLIMTKDLLSYSDVNIRNAAGECPFDVALAQFQVLPPRPVHRSMPYILPPEGALPDTRDYLDIILVLFVEKLFGLQASCGQVDQEIWQRTAQCLCNLLAAGANPNSRIYGQPLLSYLLAHPSKTEAFGLLFEFTYNLTKLADPTAVDSTGMTALHHAILAGQQDEGRTGTRNSLARQRWTISTLVERLSNSPPNNLTERNSSREGATAPPPPLVLYARLWNHDQDFLRVAMRLVQSGADTAPLTPRTHPDVFSQELKRVVGYGAITGVADYRLRPIVVEGVPPWAAVWVSACRQDSWDSGNIHLRVLKKCVTESAIPDFHQQAFGLLAHKFSQKPRPEGSR